MNFCGRYFFCDAPCKLMQKLEGKKPCIKRVRIPKAEDDGKMMDFSASLGQTSPP